MRYELFIARRLKLGADQQKGSASLRVAMLGICLAIVVMILSIAIVLGFKHEITDKIYCLDAHLKVSNAALGIDDNYSTINGHSAATAILADPNLAAKVASMSLIIDQPAILKTDNDFEGIVYRGVDKSFDWTYLNDHLVEGRVPVIDSDTADVNEILVSTTLANRLNLHVGDRVYAYFIQDKVKARNTRIVGLVNTDFENFDKQLIVGNISQLQQVNGWNTDTGHYLAVNVKDLSQIEPISYQTFTTLARHTVMTDSPILHIVSDTHKNNQAFFAWLDMLDMNAVVILVLMLIVSGFTLITAMLMIVLERIRLIGMLKALGADNRSIRRIFIFLTGKLVLRALLWGNIIGIGLALAQKYFHIIHLDPTVYYMNFVPIHLPVAALLLLNLGIVVVAYLTLIGPSHIISTIRPTVSMRFE